MTIVHERTLTSRQVRELENELARRLKTVALLIRKDTGFPHNIPLLQQKYGAEVRSIIQSTIQRTYMAGLEYVAKFEDIPALLTQQDLQNIQEQTQFEVEGFWRTITRDSLNQQVPDITKKVNIPTAAGLIATAATIGTLALATIHKTRELGDNESEVMWVTALDERVCPICRPRHGRKWKINDPALLRPIKDSHPNCRCRLLLKSGREVFSH